MPAGGVRTLHVEDIVRRPCAAGQMLVASRSRSVFLDRLLVAHWQNNSSTHTLGRCGIALSALAHSYPFLRCIHRVAYQEEKEDQGAGQPRRPGEHRAGRHISGPHPAGVASRIAAADEGAGPLPTALNSLFP